MAVLLTCDSLEKSFGARTVFTGIALSLHDEDRMGIIGPNIETTPIMLPLSEIQP